jgi:hypothetical protein
MPETPPKNPHTLKLAMEREVMETLGVTRSQARAGLLAAAKLNATAQIKKETEDAALTKRIEAKVAKAVAAVAQEAAGQKFEPRPFRLDIDAPNVGIPAGEVSTDTRDVLVINPTTDIYGSPYTIETSTAVPWPDGTACAVDIADQDDSIAFCGYRVKSGYLYLRWISFASGSALPTPLSGDDITITAFL